MKYLPSSALLFFLTLSLIWSLVSAQLFLPRWEVGQIRGADIKEGSGLAASRRNDGVLWAHEDLASGDTVRLHAMTTNGDYLGNYILRGVINKDMEDMAVGPGPDPDASYIYLGDIGDNWRKIPAREYVTIYRIKEPLPPDRTNIMIDEDEVDTLKLWLPGAYDSDDYRDSETLLVDPILGEIYVLEKRSGDKVTLFVTEPNTIYRSGSFEADLEDRGEMDGIGTLTAGDISPTGGEILLKRWEEIYYFTRSGDYPVSQALLDMEGFQELEYEPELQGEGIAFAADNTGFYTSSEAQKEESVPLYWYRRNGPAPDSNPVVPRPPSTPTPTLGPTTAAPTPTPPPVDPNLIQYICNNACLVKLKRCQGDCDTDEDCEENLVCFQREEDNEPVPTCVGGDAYEVDHDFCVPRGAVPTITIGPTKVPSQGPTTLEPTSAPILAGSVQFVCDEDCPSLLLKCQGDCDNDDDCEGEDAICWQRDEANQEVPGCIGGETYGEDHDFCILTSDLPTLAPNAVQFVCDEEDCTSLLSKCEGDCDRDEDCAGEGAICWQRDNGNEAVPGCVGGETYEEEHDFCILTSDLPEATSAPAPPDLLLLQFPCRTGCESLPRCAGDCDEDEDCVGEDAICWQRDANEAVPGCAGGETYEGSWDFCIRACDLPDSAEPCPFEPESLVNGTAVNGTLAILNTTDIVDGFPNDTLEGDPPVFDFTELDVSRTEEEGEGDQDQDLVVSKALMVDGWS